MLDTAFFDTHSHALVDRLAAVGLPDDVPTQAIVPSELKNEAHLLPLLIPLRDVSPEQRAWILGQTSTSEGDSFSPAGATLLAANTETMQLAAHLKDRLLIRLAGKKKGKALLRYYDPRVFTQLQWMLSAYQLKALFGPIAHWSVHLDGTWHTTPRPSVESLHWTFDAKCCAHLERIGLINQTLLKLPDISGKARIQSGPVIDEALAYAQQRYHLTQDDDRVAFATHAMTVHPEFDRHPTIQKLLAQLAGESQTYADAAALLSESDWQRIGADLAN